MVPGQVFMGYKMNMSYYTDSAMLQTMMEIPLEKKAGRLYAPPGKLQMIYFIDDLNMPALDKYNTQSAIELIKQKQDYSHWYDRAKIQVKAYGFTVMGWAKHIGMVGAAANTWNSEGKVSGGYHESTFESDPSRYIHQ